jgi:hypothetical protein
VDDLVDGIVRLIETADAVTGPINIGTIAYFEALLQKDGVRALVGGEK